MNKNIFKTYKKRIKICLRIINSCILLYLCPFFPKIDVSPSYPTYIHICVRSS